MPRGDVAGTGSGSERRTCNHSVCVFELWSPEISGPRTSAYYRETLTRALTEPNPLTYDEQKAAEAVSVEVRLILIGRTPTRKFSLVCLQ